MLNIENISKVDFLLAENYFASKTPDSIIEDYIYISAVNLRLKNSIKNNPRFFFQKLSEIPDEKEFKELSKKYEHLKELFEAKLEEFKKSHEEWFELSEVQMTFKPSEEVKEKAQNFVDSIESEDAKCYLYFKTKSLIEQYKAYMKGKSEFMTTKRSIKEEFKKEYSEFSENLRKEIGFPKDSELKSKVKFVPGLKQVQLRAISLKVEESFENLKIV